MSKVLFISANTSIYPYIVFPLGMAIVSRAVKEAGHELRQFDFLVEGKSYEKLKHELDQFDPDFVLISIRNIDNVDSTAESNDWQLDCVREIVNMARLGSKRSIICGGPGFSVMPENILAYVGADHGVVGEGEGVIASLLTELESEHTAEVPAIIYANDPKNTKYYSNRSLTPYCENSLIEFYNRETGIFNLLTKRGCSFKCSYCTYPSIDGNRFRPKAIDEVIDCIQQIKDEHGVTEFFFTDSIFNDPQGHYIKFCRRLIERKVGIRWSAFFTPRDKNLDQLDMLMEAGLFAVELGTDAGSNATLAGLRKGFTFEDVHQFNEACVKNKLFCAHYIIFGGPNETPQTLDEGLANIATLRTCVVFAYSGIRILPQTEIHRLAIEQGIIDKSDDLLHPRYYFSPEIEPDYLNTTVSKAFRRNPTRVFPPRNGQIMSSLLRKHDHKGLLWDKLIKFPE